MISKNLLESFKYYISVILQCFSIHRIPYCVNGYIDLCVPFFFLHMEATLFMRRLNCQTKCNVKGNPYINLIIWKDWIIALEKPNLMWAKSKIALYFTI